MEAMESQLAAHRLLSDLKGDSPIHAHDRHLFRLDAVLVKAATPFMWSADTSRATLAASASIPPDTLLSPWNLNTSAVWWWFEDPLPISTLGRGELQRVPDGIIGVRALCFGWIQTELGRALGCTAWCDSEHTGMRDFCRITPSQTWSWLENSRLDEMLARSKAAYSHLYGPGGPHEHAVTAGLDTFMAASDGLSRFILAGLAWLGQQVLLESDGHIERHRRKDFNRQTGQDLRHVRVVQLRRRAPTHSASTDEDKKVDWSCQWTVGGHFRNQACGPNHADRRLTWVHPYVKGPDDKPLRVPQQKVYVVNR